MRGSFWAAWRSELDVEVVGRDHGAQRALTADVPREGARVDAARRRARRGSPSQSSQLAVEARLKA